MADNYDDYSREELLRELRLRDRRPRFGLVWERKEIEHEKAVNDDFVTLDFVPALSCGEAPYRNLIIEGDNFDALRYLRMTHAGKVNCIYIDPPYNTGNRDFIYNDRFIDEDDTYRHSKWLEFMNRRLLLARDLLAEDGVIFASIDDNEAFNLGLLMNGIFGERNWITTLIWQKSYAPKNAALHFSCDHEYIICFASNKDVWRPNQLPRNAGHDKTFSNPDNDKRGDWTSGPIQARNFNRAGNYPISCPSGRIIQGPPTGSYWRYSKDKFDELDQDKRIWWGKDGSGVPRIKRFLSEVKQGVVPQTLWRHEEVGHTADAKKEMHDILQFQKSEDMFSTPKPHRLIERILQIATKPNDIVLDFFAGSGTTAHAVMKINAEDGGNRRFILVSNTEATESEPDKNLCRDVCAERVRRVSQGYTNKKDEAVTGMGGGFAYFRTHRHATETLFNSIQHEAIWTALQLIHTETISPFDTNTLIQRLELDNTTVLYLPKINETVLKDMQALIANGSILVIYSWQPGLLRQHFEDDRISFLPIPQFLVDRFGNGGIG